MSNDDYCEVKLFLLFHHRPDPNTRRVDQQQSKQHSYECTQSEAELQGIGSWFMPDGDKNRRTYLTDQPSTHTGWLAMPGSEQRARSTANLSPASATEMGDDDDYAFIEESLEQTGNPKVQRSHEEKHQRAADEDEYDDIYDRPPVATLSKSNTNCHNLATREQIRAVLGDEAADLCTSHNDGTLKNDNLGKLSNLITQGVNLRFPVPTPWKRHIAADENLKIVFQASVCVHSYQSTEKPT
ncbi:hypothetical protein F25303_3794 [Fusarium sp. NRRL 25303]|nr:hypothetical protein F25303_3794 [Fusarium sp. NRRL 25303]